MSFDPDAVEGDKLGLREVRDRLDHLGGAMTIASTPGTGTRIELAAPIAAAGSLEESA